MTHNPDKTIWKSIPYRKWIRRHLHCPICGISLLDHKESYQGHHHGHSGGKTPADHLIVPLCDQCHSAFHFKEDRFNAKWGMKEETWLDLCLKTLRAYLEAKNITTQWVMLNALQKVAEDNS